MIWILMAAALILGVLSHRWQRLARMSVIAAIVCAVLALYDGAGLTELGIGAVILSLVLLI